MTSFFCEISFVDEDGKPSIGHDRQTWSAVPRIGDALQLKIGGEIKSFRVVDIVWEPLLNGYARGMPSVSLMLRPLKNSKPWPQERLDPS